MGYPIASGTPYKIIKGDYTGLVGQFVGYDEGGHAVVLKIEVERTIKEGKETKKIREMKEVRKSPTSIVPVHGINTLILHQQAKLRNTQSKAVRNIPESFQNGVRGKQVTFGRWLIQYDDSEYEVTIGAVRSIQ